MDGRNFDELTRKLANGASRRSVLKGLIGGGAALVGLRATSAIASPVAVPKKVDICHFPPGHKGEKVNAINVAWNGWVNGHSGHALDSISGGCCTDHDCPTAEELGVCVKSVSCQAKPVEYSDGKSYLVSSCVAEFFDDEDEVECRAQDGPCDVAEYCNGSGPDCPGDGVAGTDVLCREADGPCDVDDYCDGETKGCADNVAGTDVLCREADGPCDVDDYCDGETKGCADNVAGADVLCREADGPCDVDDYCDGETKGCADNVAGTDVVCREAGLDATCDPAETCDGSSKTCPQNGFASNTTPCDNGNGTCDGAGNCVPNPSVCKPTGDTQTCTHSDQCCNNNSHRPNWTDVGCCRATDPNDYSKGGTCQNGNGTCIGKS